MIMEILNNIWMVLSMPNEGLLNIITIPLFFVENYLTLLLFMSILNIDVPKKQKIIYYIAVPFLGMVSMQILPSPLCIFFDYFMILIVAYLTFKIHFFKSFVSIIISALIYNLVGALILNPYLTIFNISTNQLLTIPLYRIPYILLVYVLIGFIIFALKNRSFKISLLDNMDNKTKKILFSNLILGITAIIVQSIISVYYTDKLPIIITFLSFISLLSYFALSIYSLTRAFKLTLTTQKLESAEEYNNTLRILHDNVRGFKHDFDNIVTTIGGYIKTEDIEGLKKYYSQLEDDCQRVNNLYILNPDVVKNDGIYNLLTKKYYEAESKDIKVTITFLLDLSTLNMKIYEFARILGILLDNAIEASSECEEKALNITFKNDTKNYRQLLTIENTYNTPDIDTEKIYEKGISGKENHTGIGLWEVRKLVKKNNNVNIFTSKNDKYFIQQLEIYDNK